MIKKTKQPILKEGNTNLKKYINTHLVQKLEINNVDLQVITEIKFEG